MGLVRTLIEHDQEYAQAVLPQGLCDLYDGDLQFPAGSAQRPYVIGNFVSTLDGVVSFKVKGCSDGSAISGSDPADRFIMGLLRASADAVLVGAGTVHDESPESLWIPEYTYPDAKQLIADLLTSQRSTRRSVTSTKSLTKIDVLFWAESLHGRASMPSN